MPVVKSKKVLKFSLPLAMVSYFDFYVIPYSVSRKTENHHCMIVFGHKLPTDPAEGVNKNYSLRRTYAQNAVCTKYEKKTSMFYCLQYSYLLAQKLFCYVM